MKPCYYLRPTIPQKGPLTRIPMTNGNAVRIRRTRLHEIHLENHTSLPLSVQGVLIKYVHNLYTGQFVITNWDETKFTLQYISCHVNFQHATLTDIDNRIEVMHL